MTNRLGAEAVATTEEDVQAGRTETVWSLSGEEYAVTYEADGIADEDILLRLSFGDRITEFDGAMTVAESGFVRAICYDITVENERGPRREAVTLGLEAPGETTVSEPDWVDTVREEGVRFTVAPTEDGTAVEVEMVNGLGVPAGARVSLSDGRGRAEAELSDDGALLVGTDGPPEGAPALESFFRVTIRSFTSSYNDFDTGMRREYV